MLRALYDEKALTEKLKEVYGAKTTLGSPGLTTGLLIVTKRLDSNSPWPLGNNPALQAFMYATLDGYRVGWPMGADKILLVSLGTGSRDPTVTPSSITASHAVKSLLALMDDCAALVETLLQW